MEAGCSWYKKVWDRGIFLTVKLFFDIVRLKPGLAGGS